MQEAADGVKTAAVPTQKEHGEDWDVQGGRDCTGIPVQEREANS